MKKGKRHFYSGTEKAWAGYAKESMDAQCDVCHVRLCMCWKVNPLDYIYNDSNRNEEANESILFGTSMVTCLKARR